jgi:phosphatidate cytidylyltransferase
MVMVLATVALLEVYRLFEKKGAKPFTVDGVIAGILITLAFEMSRVLTFVPNTDTMRAIQSSTLYQTHLIVIILILFLLWIFIRELFRNNGSAIANLTATIFGVLYVPLFFGTFIGIYALFRPDSSALRFVGCDSVMVERWGHMTLLSIFAVIWVCDSAAFFGGRVMGRHKLSERISPKKTWEGAVWGLIGAVGAAVATKYLLIQYLTFDESIIVGIIVGIVGQVGDLAESLLKRDAGVKDSSTIIPGHGGVLDRFDSLLFASPVLYLYLSIILMRQ